MSNSNNNDNQQNHPSGDERHENSPNDLAGAPEMLNADSPYDSDPPPSLRTESAYSDSTWYTAGSTTASITTDGDGEQDLDGFDLDLPVVYDVDEDADGPDALEARTRPEDPAAAPPVQERQEHRLRGGDPDRHRLWILLLACIMEEHLRDSVVLSSRNPWGDDL